MSNYKAKIISQALDLPPTERAELIERLLSSFNNSSNNEIEKRWANEAEERIKAYEAGKIATVSAKEVFKKLNKNSVDEG